MREAQTFRLSNGKRGGRSGGEREDPSDMNDELQVNVTDQKS